jgi:hypothetical protein
MRGQVRSRPRGSADQRCRRRHARSRAALATARLVIAEARKRFEEPAAEFAEVAGAWQVHGCQVERAHTLLLGGRWLLGLGRGAEAARPLSEAEAVFERLQARPLAAEAARLLAAAAQTSA